MGATAESPWGARYTFTRLPIVPNPCENPTSVEVSTWHPWMALLTPLLSESLQPGVLKVLGAHDHAEPDFGIELKEEGLRIFRDL